MQRGPLMNTLVNYQLVSVQSNHFLAGTHGNRPFQPNALTATEAERIAKQSPKVNAAKQTLADAGYPTVLSTAEDWRKLASLLKQRPVKGFPEAELEPITVQRVSRFDKKNRKSNQSAVELLSQGHSHDSLQSVEVAAETLFHAQLMADAQWGGWTEEQLKATSLHGEILPLASQPNLSELSLVVDNELVQIMLRRNDELFADTYREERQVWLDGKRMKELEKPPRSKQDIEMCYYRGIALPQIRMTESLRDFQQKKVSPHLRAVSVLAAQDVTSESSTRTVPLGQDLNTVPKIQRVSLQAQRLQLLNDLDTTAAKSFLDQKTTSWAALDTCHGGFSGVFRLGTVAYEIVPALNVLTQYDLAIAMASAIEAEQAMAGVDYAPLTLGSLHVVYRVDRDSLISPTNSMGIQSALSRSTCGVQNPQGSSSGHVHQFNAAALLKGTSSAHHHHSRHSHHELDEPTNEAGSLLTVSEAASAAQSGQSDVSAQDLPDTVHVKMLLGNDNKRVQAKAAATESSAAEIANVVATLYANAEPTLGTEVKVHLVAQVSFTIADPWTVPVGTCANCNENEVSVNQLLSAWASWRANSPSAPEHDNGHLLSYHDFEESVVGYAYLSAMCNRPINAGIEMSTNADVAFNAAVLAHEMGHNFAMQHDDPQVNGCDGSGYIMRSTIGATPPDSFSTCSASYFQSFVTTEKTCLLTPPASIWTDSPVCGNGFVEAGEECDCGQADCSDIDPCCDGVQCKLVNGATCSAADSCCDSTTCSPRPSGFVCRPAATVCDLEEVCDGSSGKCPMDLVKGPGHQCSASFTIPGHGTVTSSGACYLGACVTHDRSCYVTGQTVSGGPYLACPFTQSDFCARKLCRSLANSNPNLCYSFVTDRVVQMDDGVPCGGNRSCYASSCVSQSKLPNAFSWYPLQWETCSACGEPQTRDILCRDADSIQTVSTEVCTPAAKPATERLCENDELFCVYPESLAEGKTRFMGVEMHESTVTYGAVGFVLLLLAGCALFYRAVSKPVDGMKNIQQRNAFRAMGIDTSERFRLARVGSFASLNKAE